MGSAYLVRRVKTHIPVARSLIESSESWQDDGKSCSERSNLQHPQDPFEAVESLERPMLVEHHILWSMSYGVPLLYFNAWNSGKQLCWKVFMYLCNVKNCNIIIHGKELCNWVGPIRIQKQYEICSYCNLCIFLSCGQKFDNKRKIE